MEKFIQNGRCFSFRSDLIIKIQFESESTCKNKKRTQTRYSSRRSPISHRAPPFNMDERSGKTWLCCPAPRDGTCLPHKPLFH